MRWILPLIIAIAPPLHAQTAPGDLPVQVIDRSAPTGVMTPETPATPPLPVSTGVPVPAATPGTDPSMLTSMLGACGSALSGLFGTGSLIRKEADEENERRGYREVEGLDEDVQQDVARKIRANMPGDCSNLVDKDGKFGPWAHTAIQEIRDRKSSYVDNEPRDILRLCPGYKGMNKEKREGFWLWVFASIASSESSCNPKVVNPKCNRTDAANKGCRYNPNSPPNGDALGLFQLEPRRCEGANREELLQPLVNVRCAVKVLGGELSRRNNLQGCNSGGSATYWGPLNGCTTHAGDGSAKAKTLALIPKFSGC